MPLGDYVNSKSSTVRVKVLCACWTVQGGAFEVVVEGIMARFRPWKFRGHETRFPGLKLFQA